MIRAEAVKKEQAFTSRLQHRFNLMCRPIWRKPWVRQVSGLHAREDKDQTQCHRGRLNLLLFSRLDYSPPGSFVHGISQARILEWVAISFSRGSSQPGTEPMSPALAGAFFTTEPPGRPKMW